MIRAIAFLITAFSFASISYAEPATVRILHINDLHGFANATQQAAGAQPLGGGAQLAAMIGMERIDDSSILLVAGDVIQGDNWTNFSEGKSAIELVNMLGGDAMVTGNHEFDFGQETLKKRISEANFPVLAANLKGISSVKPKALFRRNGVRISVIGLVTEDTPQSSHPRNTVGLSFKPPYEEASEQIKEAIPEADLIILLTHIGYERDMELAKKLCDGHDAVKLPIIIVGGHSHTRVEKPSRIGNCAVAQAWEHGKTLGIIDVSIDSGKLLDLSGHLKDITPALGNGDTGVANLVERYNRKNALLLGKKIGTASVDLVQTGVRLRETNLGNMIADIVRETTGAEVSIINGGSIRTGIPKGEITVGQIYATIPFNNYLVAVRMSGKQLIDALEHGVSGIENGEGRFPQVSGIRFTFDPMMKAGSRIVSATAGGLPILPEKDYTVATLDFIAAGGDGYRSFGEAIRDSGDFSEVAGAMKSSRLVYNDPGKLLRNVVLETIAGGRPVAPMLNGRITEAAK